MWSDNETDRDFLNFGGVADTVAEIIVQADGRPVSIGVSGVWGVGKSSLVKLIRLALENRQPHTDEADYIFVEFNAWLYQGYDDARAALLDVIARRLETEAAARKKGREKAKELVGRVDWLRTVKFGVGLAPLLLGLPPVGLLGDIASMARTATSDPSEENLQALLAKSEQGAASARSLTHPSGDTSPPQAIEAIRGNFETVLAEMHCRLVVLIDDLDRCLPPTAISTLEAVRLFLFLENTAFVIAADDAMIRHAVRSHFDGIDEPQLMSYFDKLIQVPIRVPPLGTQEVRAYLMMLYVDNSSLAAADKERIRALLENKLANTWRGERVTRDTLADLDIALPTELVTRLEVAERLAPLMTSARQIAGNPRLVKRFLNAISIRLAISQAHGVGVDESVLAKMLLFERCGDPQCYTELLTSINDSDDGKPEILRPWESSLDEGNAPALAEGWETPFVRQWLALPPRLADLDLRGVVYVSREYAPLITPEDRLSPDGIDVLSALLQVPGAADGLSERISELSQPERSVIMGSLLTTAGIAPTAEIRSRITACLAVARVDQTQAVRLSAFLVELPADRVTAALVPLISGESWAGDVFVRWRAGQVSAQIKAAIDRESSSGDISVQ